MALEVEASDPAGIDSVEFAWYDGEAEAWVELGADDAAPYRVALDVAELRPGDNYVLAEAYDAYGNRAPQHVWIERTEPADPIAIISPRHGARIKAKRSLTVGAALSDPIGSAVVKFRSCGGSACSWGVATPLGTDAGAPYGVGWRVPAAGTVTFLAQVTDGDGSDLSDPVTVSIQKAKKKKKKKR